MSGRCAGEKKDDGTQRILLSLLLKVQNENFGQDEPKTKGEVRWWQKKKIRRMCVNAGGTKSKKGQFKRLNRYYIYWGYKDKPPFTVWLQILTVKSQEVLHVIL